MALTDKQIKEAGKKPEDIKNTTVEGGVPVEDARLNKLGKSGVSLANALDLILPFFSQSVTGQLAPADQALLSSALSTIPGFADLQRDVALKDAETTRQIYTGDLGAFETGARKADELSRAFDPEFYSTRTDLSTALSQLLSPGLTGGERAEVERSLGRDNARSGNLPGTGSNLATVSNAMTFGNAARNRLADAISRASQVFPQLRTGVAAPGGISATPGSKVGLPQAPTLGSTGMNLAGGLLGSLSGTQNQQVAAHLAPKASDLERGAGIFGNLAGGLGSLVSFSKTV
jgi:hypothetical protein